MPLSEISESRKEAVLRGDALTVEHSMGKREERVAGELASRPERSGTLVRVTQQGRKATSRDRTRSSLSKEKVFDGQGDASLPAPTPVC